MSQRQDIPDGFNIYERLYLDRDGHPNCINHQQKGARETDLDSHIIHLRTRNFSEDDKLALHAAIQVVQHNGLVDRQWLEELLKKGDPNFSRQCCGPETSTVRKRTAARAPTSKTDNLWVLRPELYQALSINGERPLRFIKTLQRYPFQEVESLVQEAIQTRIDRGGRGVRKDLFLSRPDVEYIKGELVSYLTFDFVAIKLM